MKITVDHIKNSDATYSKNGKPDFAPQESEVRSLPTPSSPPRPRTRASLNNSYT